MESLRILIVTSKFPRFVNDPQPPFVFYFARELVKLGHKVAVVAPHAAGAKKHEFMDGIEIFRHQYFVPASWQCLSYGPGIPTNINKSVFAAFQMPFFILSQILLARSVVKKFRPDVVHAHWGFPQGLSARFTGVPYFINFYGGELFMARKFRLMWLLDYVVNHSRRSFTVTDYYVQLMHEMGIRGDIGAIPLGVDVSTFHPDVKGSDELRQRFCSRNELMVLFVGRLVERKGCNYLVEAFADVVKEVPNAKLVVVGGGPMDSLLRKMASGLGIAGRVVFCGEITNSELPAYYCAADIFVLPSIIDRHGDREGQGVVYIEAMACKTPVIGTNTGGIPYVISRDVGVMVEEKNSKELASAIIRLLKDSVLRKSMGEKAYKRVMSRFTWAKIAQEYVDVFRDCVVKR